MSDEEEEHEYTEEEIQAATKLEAIQRGNHDRAKVRQMKEDAIAEHAQETGMSEEDAALRIEAVCRGRRDRARVKKMKEEQEQEQNNDAEDEEENEETNTGMSEEDAAIRIEAHMRGKQDREKVRLMKEEKQKQKEEEEEEEEERRRQKQEEEEEEEERRRQEEKDEKEKQEIQQAEAQAKAEAEEQAEVVEEEQQQPTTNTGVSRRRKKTKKKKGPNQHKVHPDDVELCEPREIGSRTMLRNLHIGNRNLPGSPVIYLLGTYTEMEEETKERVKSLFSHGVAVAASVSDAVIVDGGLNSHLSSAETTAEVRPLSSILGVSRCEGMYGIDADLSNFHHHHVVVRCNTKALWMARLKLIRSIIGGDKKKRPRPVLIILAGKEDGCEVILRAAAQNKWGIIIVPNTGGHADELLSAVNEEGTGTKTMQYISDHGNISIFPQECGPSEMRTLCRTHLMLNDLADLMMEEEDE